MPDSQLPTPNQFDNQTPPVNGGGYPRAYGRNGNGYTGVNSPPRDDMNFDESNTIKVMGYLEILPDYGVLRASAEEAKSVERVASSDGEAESSSDSLSAERLTLNA